MGGFDPAGQPPFAGETPPPLERPNQRGGPPGGYALSPQQVIRIADGTDAVREERAQSPAMDPVAYTFGPRRWQVRYFTRDAPRTAVAEVHIEDPSGRVLEAWRDHQVEVLLARGYDDAVAQGVNSPYVWLPLSVLFLLPFVDPRRPLRLLHLDLLVLLGFAVSLYFFNRAEIVASVALTYPVLAYVFLRMLWIGFRPRGGRGSLVPVLPLAALAAIAVVLAAGRIALNVADSQVIDIGLAGVVGAERIEDGQGLYEGVFAPGIDLRGDVYGPANYLTYMPFEQALPWSGVWDDVPAAHAVAIVFDLLTALGLLLLGRRLREGEAGKTLGVAFAYAWLAFPFTLYAMNANTNDAVVAALVVGAMLALASPPARGAIVALGTAVKFGPAGLAPLFAAGTGERRARSIAIFTLAFVAVSLVLFLPFLPDGGPRELYDRTLGYQASRGSPFSVWGLAPSLDFLQPVVRAAAVALAVAVAFYPRRRGPVQIAALGAAVTIAVQAGAIHWFYFSILWFLPLTLVALLALPRGGSGDRRPQAS